MSNYNTQLQSNNTDLQQVLQTLQTKAAGGEQATPEISVNSNGLITATAGTKSSTHQLAFQPAKTITPSAASQIAVSSGYYTGGDVTVAGDANLVASNIKSGVSIFGVSGNYAGSGGSGDTSAEDGIIMKTISSCTNDRVTSIGKYAFYDCTSLTTASFPKVTSIGRYAFYDCNSLTTANFPVATSIGSSAFGYCYKLKSLYLTGSSLCNLSNSNAFYSTPIGGYSKSAGTYGSIYVPASLLTSYQTATNWTYFSSRFVGI